MTGTTYRLIIKGQVEDAINVTQLQLQGSVEVLHSRQLRDGLAFLLVRDRDERWSFRMLLGDWFDREKDGPARDGSLLLWSPLEATGEVG